MANAFVDTIGTERTTTTNGMEAFVGSMNSNVDLFYKIGAMRGQDVVPLFAKAFAENKELALRIALWARDVRGGAGERQIYRDILQWLETRNEAAATALAFKTPEVGRWDDLLQFRYSKDLQALAFFIISAALNEGNALCAKWMPRKGAIASSLRSFMNLTPKQYRKTLVALTDVVETKMCAKQWDKIDFGKLPSQASSRYKTAFYRNAEAAYKAYAERLKKGTDKVNASAIYPYEVLKGLSSYGFNSGFNETQRQVILSQWDALPDYMGDDDVLAMVDVSGSMTCAIGNGSTKSTCLDVAVSLGLYVADKNKGAFKDTFLTFSGSPELLKLKGNILEKADQMVKSHWAMNTDLMKAFRLILDHAVRNQATQKDMPKFVLILSDMQFDACASFGGTAMETIKKHYAAAGYEVPKVIFWNLHSHDNVPARFNEQGVALVSGFSPAIMKALLKGDTESFTPEHIMWNAVMVPRYDLNLAA